MSTFIQNYRDLLKFREERFNPISLAETERSKVVLACLEQGQFIPVHSPKVDVMLLVLEGEGTLVAGEHKQQVEPGAVAFAAAGEVRGVKAGTRMVILHVVAPRPTQLDHLEVMSKLEKGRGNKSWNPSILFIAQGPKQRSTIYKEGERISDSADPPTPLPEWK